MRARTSLLPLLLALGVSLAGGAQAATLRIGLQEDPDALDPARGGTFIGRVVMAAFCDKLIDVDPKLGFRPQLATEWSWSPDNRALTLHLRDGVVFHDGEKLDAEAVKLNLDRYRTAPESQRKAELRPVQNVVVVDPRTVRIELSEPYAPLLGVLSDRAGMILSPKALPALAAGAVEKPACSGPFRFVERVAQQRIVFDRFDRYWDAPSIHFDRVIYSPIPDTTVRLANLQAGSLDVIERVSPTDTEAVRGSAKTRLVESTALGFNLISINLGNTAKADNPLGRNPKVREAFELSLDRKALNEVVFEGLFVPSNQPQAPGTTYYDPDWPVPARDVARAKALLAEAGTPRVAFTLMVPNSPVDMQVGQVIQAMAAEAGFDVQLQATEAATLTATTSTGDYQAALTIWSGRADPDGNISPWLDCKGFLNWGKYCSPQLDGALAKGRATTDPDARVKDYREAAAIYLAARPLLVLYHFRWLWGIDRRLEGFVPYPDGIVRLQGMRLPS
jgi:peptide/nickel transport system substrate-binding protein